MVYTDSDGQKKYPYVIHRTSLGCYERTLALLIEKYAGALPTWMAPEQVRVLAITDRANARCEDIKKHLSDLGIRAETDLRNEKIGFKIREARMERVPYLLVIGDAEIENGEVAVRSRSDGDLGTTSLDTFATKLLLEIASRAKVTGITL